MTVKPDVETVKGDKEYTDPQARELWTHEDQLINQRVQWLCVTQGLLFAAYSLSFQLPESILRDSHHKFSAFVSVIPVAGVWVSLLALLGIVSAFGAMFVIHGRSPWKRPGVTWLTTLGGILCAIGIPLMFTLVWLKVMNMSVIRFFGATAGVAEELLF